MLLLFLLAFIAAKPLVSYAELRRIQALATTWKAEMPSRFVNVTEDEFRSMLMQPEVLRALATDHAEGAVELDDPDTPLPPSYDIRDEYPHCSTGVFDQGICGSCWAFSAIGAFAERRCISGVDEKAVFYSQQYPLSCAPEDGCLGGLFLPTWKFLSINGTPTLDCVQYKDFRNFDGTSPCPVTCDDGSEIQLYKSDGFEMFRENIPAIMRSLVARGPVQTLMAVFNDLTYYSSGVYRHTSGNINQGFHAVEIIGYGTTEYDNTDYWIVRNSWGTGWGEGGYFRIVRGVNECGIEDEVYSGYFIKRST